MGPDPVEAAPHTPQEELDPTLEESAEPAEPKEAEPPSLIIVGGGWAAIHLARLNPGSLLIEKEGRWAKRLALELPECKIQVGDGAGAELLRTAGAESALHLVLLTGSDEGNLEVAATAHEHFPQLRLLAKLHDYANGPALHKLTVKAIKCDDENLPTVFNDLLHEQAKSLAEVFLVEGHPWVGERLARVELPAGSQAIALRRGDELLAPEAEALLAVNDVLLLLCSQAPGTLVGQALSSPENVRPFHRFMVILTDAPSLGGRFQEALALCRTSGAKLLLAGPARMEGLLDQAVAEADEAKVETERLVWEAANISRLLRAGAASQVGAEEGEPQATDCVILSLPARRSPLNWLKGSYPLVDVLLEKGHPPVLVARAYGPYQRVLVALDGRKPSLAAAHYALRFARLFDATIHLLVYHGFGHDAVESQRRTLQRAAQAYRLELTEEVVTTHLGLEFMHRLQQEEFDLAVVAARSPPMRYEMLKMALLRAPCSMLVIP